MAIFCWRCVPLSGCWYWAIVGIGGAFCCFSIWRDDKSSSHPVRPISFCDGEHCRMVWPSMDKTSFMAALFQHDRCGLAISPNCVCWCCASSVSDPCVVEQLLNKLLYCPKNRQRLQQPVITSRHWCFCLDKICCFSEQVKRRCF